MTIDTETLVLGAGLTGLTVAAGLRRAGQSPIVLDKSRGLGGRLATRRAGDLRFDHGAQYLRPKTAEFMALLDWLKTERAADVWPAIEGGAPAHVGLPGMSGLVRPLAEGLDIRSGVEVAQARWVGDQWELTDRAGDLCARARVLVSAIPAPQVARVLAGHALVDRLAGVVMEPCWTLMAAFEARPDLPDVMRTPDSPLAWIARDGSKPRRGTETWVVQASADWSRANLELSQEDTVAALLKLLADRAGGHLPGVVHAAAHRWRFSQASVPLGAPCLADAADGLVLAGDWCLGGRAEHAFQSAQAALIALERVGAKSPVG